MRTIGSKNKNPDLLPHYASLPLEERVKFLANLMVERIQADQQDGGKLLKRIESGSHVRRQLPA